MGIVTNVMVLDCLYGRSTPYQDPNHWGRHVEYLGQHLAYSVGFRV